MIRFLINLPEEVATNARYVLDFWAQIGFGDPIVFLLFLAGVFYSVFVYFKVDSRFAMILMIILLLLGALTFTSPLSLLVISITVLFIIFVLVLVIYQITT